MDVRVLSYEETVELLSPADCVKAIREAFEEEAKGWTVNRPRSHSIIMHDREGEEDRICYALKTMDGIIKARGYAALRIASMLMLRNHRVGGRLRDEYYASIPSPSGKKGWLEVVMLFETEAGELRAMMPGGYIQVMRVGSTTAVGNSYMARKNSKVFGIIGAGWQATSQLLAHNEIFPIERVKVYSVTPTSRERFAREMSIRLGLPVEPVASAEEAVRGSDVLLCATNSHDPNSPVFKGEWLEPGMHWSIITREAGNDAFERSDRVAVLSHAVARNAWASADRIHQRVDERQPIDVEQFPTLGDMVAGRAKGRENDHEITGFITTQGLGMQFVALASVAYERAVERNIGRVENWDHLLQYVHP